MDYITTDTELTSVANAIRTKGGTSGQLVYPNGFVNAIADISTGAELTSEDEGKVVIEDEGAYILAEQGSRTITQNGIYNTTLVSELVANISGGGGGGSTNILSGTTAPTASDGDDGDIYLFLSELPINIQPLVSSASELAVTVTANSYWTGFDPWKAFAASGNPWIGYGGDPHWLQVELPNAAPLYDVTFAVTDNQRAHAISRIGYSSDGSNYTDMALVTSTFSGGTGYARVNSPITARYFRLFFDGEYGNSEYPSIARLQMRYASGGDRSVYSVYLKVNGSWVPIEGQDIDDVNTGSDSTVLVPKTITENGTYDPADDQADGYSEVVVNVSHGSGNISEIEPYVFDMHRGYVSLGDFYYDASTSVYCDVYQVEQNTDYFILLDDIVGSRFRGMLSDFDTSTATSNIKGTSTWTDKSNPKAYEIFSFNSGTNSYLTVGKDSANTSGIKTHLFKIDDLFT